MFSDLISAIADLQEQTALKKAKEKLDMGEDPLKILDAGKKAMELVGQRFADGRYFLPELIYSGEILNGVANLVKPKITKNPTVSYIGKFVLGTVAGDIHDLGKNIVKFMFDTAGFEVYDLGVDVPAQTFVDKIRDVKPDIVGLSGLLTVAIDAMKQTIEAINESGLRDSVNIIIGGAVVDEIVYKYVGSDAYARDAVSGVAQAKVLIGN